MTKVTNKLFCEKHSSGQALITLLFFVIIGITIISAQAIVLYTNIFSASTAEQGMDAYYLAESGAEEGLMRLIRDPSYSGGTINIDSGTIDIQVAGGVITSIGTFHNAVRRIRVTTVNNNGAIIVNSWEEI